MEISPYIRLVRRWLWLIVLAAVIAGSASYVSARVQPPRYQTSTTIQIGSYISLVNPDAGMISNAAALGQTYIALAKTIPILQAVIDKLNLSLTTGGLAALFDVRLVTGTSLMAITVTYTDPVIASDIANEIAAQLIASSPTELTKEQQDQLVILQNEIAQAQDQLNNDRAELKIITANLSNQLVPDQDILVQRRTELTTDITATQGNLASMASTIASFQRSGNTNTIRVVEPSHVPTVTVNPSPVTSTVIAVVAGAILAFGGAFVIEYLNDSIRVPSEIAQHLNVPLLGTITAFGRKGSYKNKLMAVLQPRSAIAEAYRALRVNILFRDNKEHNASPCRLYTVTSAGPGEGKSVTTANLAITFATAGMQVLLVDADLRRPALHQLFDLPNLEGLSDIWAKNERIKTITVFQPEVVEYENVEAASITAVADAKLAVQLSNITQKTQISGLSVITSGPVPTNPSDLLNTVQIREFSQAIVASRQYDVVLFDTPPILVVNDNCLLANAVGAKTILVVESGRTRRATAKRAITQITTFAIPVLGVVLNRLNPREPDSDYSYQYYGYAKYIASAPTSNGTHKE